MIQSIAEGLWTFRVRLPDNPLKWLNTYVITGGGRNLLIDTGFHRRECKEDLFRGMEELGLEPRDTDVFLTHLHADHTGNASELAALGCRLIMGRVDYDLLNAGTGGKDYDRPFREGAPAEMMAKMLAEIPAAKFVSAPFEAELVEDGQVLHYGGRALECLHTPGHTPGHICLYDRENKTMFLGDHVLFDISPNITAWPACPDSLGTYLESLEKIARYDVALALPAHRSAGELSMSERAAQLIEHHARRLGEMKAVIASSPGLTAYDVAGRMSWHIRALSWEDFPVSLKWFALGETLSHLDHLRLRGEIVASSRGGSVFYYAN